MTNPDGEFNLRVPPGQWVLRVEALGYDVFRDTLTFTTGQPVTNYAIRLMPRVYEVQETDIEYRNPAIAIMREAIRRKRENRSAGLEGWKVETYNKMTLSLDNITQEKLEKAIWLAPAREFLQAHRQDTALLDSGNRLKVTIFISESVTDYYYQRPGKTREVIRASQVSGVQTDQLNVLSGTFSNVDLYENTITILGKEFVGPLASGGFLSYLYVKMGEEYTPEGDTLHIIELRPLNRFDPSFAGRLWIDARTFAIRKADLKLTGAPIVNFVEDVRLRQEFKQVQGNWLMAVRDSEIDFVNGEDGIGLRGRSITVFNNYDLEPQLPANFFREELLAVEEGAGSHDSTYWAEQRGAPLERSDVLGYALIDDLQGGGFWKWIRITSELLTTGSKRIGENLLYLGPYSRLFGYNPVEGFRTQVGLFTHPEFHPRLFGSVWGAYGFKDERWKYNAELRYKLHLRPRVELMLRRTDGIEQLGMPNTFASSNFLNGFLMRVPLFNQNYFQENYAAIEWAVMRGLDVRPSFTTKHFEPAFPFFFGNENGTGPLGNEYEIAEAGLWMRISFKQNWILRNYEKVYLDSRYPELYIELAAGIPDVLGSDFRYYRTKLTAYDNAKLGRFGWVTYTLSVGKVWGNVPYPSLFIFRGSQSYAMTTTGFTSGGFQSFAGGYNRTTTYDEVGFNLMYFYEFMADFYTVGAVDWHLEGWLLRKIPLVRRLHLKELLTARAGWGTLTTANARINDLVDPQTGYVQTVQAPDGTKPYVEVGVGIENILKIIRLDYVWRLTYRNPNAPGRLAGFQYNSGLRFNLSVGF
jgi:hypothetical protein